MSSLFFKLRWTFFLSFLFSTNCFAQENASPLSFSLGYGFKNFMEYHGMAFRDFDNYKQSALGPIYFKFTKRVRERFSWGISLGYARYHYKWTEETLYQISGQQPYIKVENDNSTYQTFSILGRANLHFSGSGKFDPYAGVGIGYRIGFFEYKGDTDDYKNDDAVRALFPLGFELTIGARYFILDNFGVYSELGVAKSVWQAGVIWNL